MFVRAKVHIDGFDLKDAIKNMVFASSHPYQGKMMDNSAAEIEEISRDVFSAVKDIL